MSRKGRVVAAIGVVVLTLVVIALFAFVAIFSMNFCIASPCPHPSPGGITVVVVFLALLFLLGLWWAWMVATGRSLRHGSRDELGPAPDSAQRPWLVAEPGADLKEYPLHEEAMAHLKAGTLVREMRRLGEHVRVRTPDGLEGWVAADRLEPTGEGGGDG
jgi:hypothetical protein